MRTQCDVRLRGSRTWRRGTLTDLEVSGGGLVVLVGGGAYGADTVETIRVYASCPVALFDAAVEGGFHVLGQPRRAEA